MMHLRVTHGSVMFCDKEHEACVTISIANDETTQDNMPSSMILDAVQKSGMKDLQYPFLISKIDDHPVYQAQPVPQLRPFLTPSWATQDQQLMVVPVVRPSDLFGWFVLGTPEPVPQIREAELKFLTITAGQLAITLENLTLLEETQKAYLGLKELQDETVRLEKIATRGQMSAEIGHELNNFLGVVAGNLQLLDFQLKKGNVQELGRYVTAMSETIEKIKVFTANLMDLTPISSQKSVIPFGKLMNEVIDYLRPQKRFQGVQIKISGTDLELPFEADTTQMQQLLFNLFNNAADAMSDQSHKEIAVRVKSSCQDNFSVTITDTGCGFPPELLAKAFNERFTTKKLGHGFGLVVCKRIIENHGGTLKVESVPNQGSTISIAFPIAHAEPVPA
jgi:signal transduction histidine kinase